MNCQYILIITNFFFKNGLISASFSLFFVFSIQLTVNVQYKFLPMAGFEPLTSGVGSNRSTNFFFNLMTNKCFPMDDKRFPLCAYQQYFLVKKT